MDILLGLRGIQYCAAPLDEGFMRITPLEQEALETMELARYYLSVGKIQRPAYLEVMGKLTETIKKLCNKRDGCPLGKHSMPCQCKGFTLVELMAVIAVIAILASIAIGKTKDTLRRAQEARTKGNLAILRTGIAVYLGNTGGMYPATLQDLTAMPIPVLDRIPLKLTPPYHPQGNSVSNGSVATMPGSAGDWYYFNNPTDSQYGSVVVNCIHSDLRGNLWSSY